MLTVKSHFIFLLCLENFNSVACLSSYINSTKQLNLNGTVCILNICINSIQMHMGIHICVFVFLCFH